MQQLTYIWVTFDVAGSHRWPQANVNDLTNGFLAYPHRHLFKFKVKVQVFSNDREIEFFKLLNFCKSCLDHYKTLEPFVLDFRNSSCEALAQELYEKLSIRFGIHRSYDIEVSEDGENGCNQYYPAFKGEQV